MTRELLALLIPYKMPFSSLTSYATKGYAAAKDELSRFLFEFLNICELNWHTGKDILNASSCINQHNFSFNPCPIK